jgi:hypothetical protein
MPDTFIIDQRARVVRQLPWPIPASVLDHLAAASDADAYWSILNTVVPRIQDKAQSSDAPSF